MARSKKGWQTWVFFYYFFLLVTQHALRQTAIPSSRVFTQHMRYLKATRQKNKKLLLLMLSLYLYYILIIFLLSSLLIFYLNLEKFFTCKTLVENFMHTKLITQEKILHTRSLYLSFSRTRRNENTVFLENQSAIKKST